MLTTIGLLALVTAHGGVPARSPLSDDYSYRPRVEVWTDRGDDPYTRGQGVRVHFRADQDAYVTILRVDSDGRVRVLYPHEPWEDNYARGGRDYEASDGYDRDAFYVDDYPGVGYIFAVAAADPFQYAGIESNDHWDYRLIAEGRVRGDPYVALTDLAQRIVPDGYRDWDYDLVPYYVQQHYDYPRFLCYDCHSYVSYPYWNPYDYTCVRFRIVVFDDPYYYPYRYYGGTRVVFTRPYRPEPRFIFKDRQGSDLFITRVRERPVNDDRRRDVGVRGRDLGGTGVIPPPNIMPPRRRPGSDVQNNPGGQNNDENDRDRGRGGRDRHDQPDHRDRGDQGDRPDRPSNPDRPDRRDRPDRLAQPERSERRETPHRRDWRERSQQPERQNQPDRPVRPAEPERRAAPVEERRAEPHRESPPPAPPPRSEPRAEPRRESPSPAPPPRSEPRAEPRREPAQERPRQEPELKRRKP